MHYTFRGLKGEGRVLFGNTIYPTLLFKSKNLAPNALLSSLYNTVVVVIYA